MMNRDYYRYDNFNSILLVELITEKICQGIIYNFFTHSLIEYFTICF